MITVKSQVILLFKLYTLSLPHFVHSPYSLFSQRRSFLNQLFMGSHILERGPIQVTDISFHFYSKNSSQFIDHLSLNFNKQSPLFLDWVSDFRVYSWELNLYISASSVFAFKMLAPDV